MFQFSPLAPLRVTGHCACGVAPFGYLRIKAWSAAPRSFSQLSHVLHRLLVPRHPPKALSSLTRNACAFLGLSLNRSRDPTLELAPRTQTTTFVADRARDPRSLLSALPVFGFQSARSLRCRCRPPRTGADLAQANAHRQRLFFWAATPFTKGSLIHGLTPNLHHH